MGSSGKTRGRTGFSQLLARGKKVSLVWAIGVGKAVEIPRGRDRGAEVKEGDNPRDRGGLRAGDKAPARELYWERWRAGDSSLGRTPEAAVTIRVTDRDPRVETQSPGQDHPVALEGLRKAKWRLETDRRDGPRQSPRRQRREVLPSAVAPRAEGRRPPAPGAEKASRRGTPAGGQA